MQTAGCPTVAKLSSNYVGNLILCSRSVHHRRRTKGYTSQWTDLVIINPDLSVYDSQRVTDSRQFAFNTLNTTRGIKSLGSTMKPLCLCFGQTSGHHQ